MIVAVAAVVVGVLLLAIASERFVHGASGGASALGVSPVVVGAVVIGFGTSAPELLVSGLAAVQGDADLGIGNIVGSNTANLALVLAIAALVSPFAVRSAVLHRELPLAVLATVAFSVALLGGLQRVESLWLLALLAGALILVVRGGGGGAPDPLAGEVEVQEGAGLRTHVVATVVGLVGTIVGAQALVWGAVRIADRLDLSGGLVGLTLVAVGTSLPELVTAVQAVRHDHHELVVGNVLGSNIFNSLAVGGLVAALAPGPVPGSFAVAVTVMLLTTAAAGVLVWTGHRLGRREGAALLTFYLVSIPFLS